MASLAPQTAPKLKMFHFQPPGAPPQAAAVLDGWTCASAGVRGRRCPTRGAPLRPPRASDYGRSYAPGCRRSRREGRAAAHRLRGALPCHAPAGGRSAASSPSSRPANALPRRLGDRRAVQIFRHLGTPTEEDWRLPPVETRAPQCSRAPPLRLLDHLIAPGAAPVPRRRRVRRAEARRGLRRPAPPPPDGDVSLVLRAGRA